MAQKRAGAGILLAGGLLVGGDEFLHLGLAEPRFEVLPAGARIDAIHHALLGEALGHDGVEARARQQDLLIHPELARGGDRVDHLADPERHADRVAARFLHLAERAGEVALVRLVGDLGPHLDLALVAELVDRRLDLLAEVGGQEHQADLLGPLVLGHVVHGLEDRVVIGRGARELPRLEGLDHLARGRDGRDVGDPLRSHQLEHRDVVWRPEVQEHREDLVAVDQLVGCLHGLRHLVAVILDDVGDLAPVDAAFRVHLVEIGVRRGDRGDRARREDAREVMRPPQLDLRVGDAGRLRPGGTRQRKDGRGGQCLECRHCLPP